MKMYHEVQKVAAVGQPDEFQLVLYTQPPWRHAIATAYHRWERATWRAWRLVEKPLWERHERLCPSGCEWGQRSDGKVDRMCGYIPVTSRQDMRCYDLQHTGRTDVHVFTITEYTAHLFGWPRSRS